MLQTRITQLFGIDHPIVQGGMQWVATAPLTAAVANAGAIGFMTALTHDDPRGLRREIRKCRDLTDKPFGVNVTLMPSLRPPDYAGMVEACVDEGVRFVETAGHNPASLLPPLREAGVIVVHKCTSLRHALKAQELGCAAVIIDGFECAGHPGEDDITTLILVPRAVDALKVPVIASGGFADGRGLAAALALGADGINMGTRFLATREAPAPDAVKQALVDADETSTSLILRSLRNTLRVLRNPVSDRVADIEARGNAGINDLAPLISGLVSKDKVWEQGDVAGGLLSVGQVVGLVRDIPTVGELVTRIIFQAEQIIRVGLPALLA
jgi:NAD(P)H-dependent flavin oxidoreductase YrpB (nitropropane dioxygenase family)